MGGDNQLVDSWANGMHDSCPVILSYVVNLPWMLDILSYVRLYTLATVAHAVRRKEKIYQLKLPT